MFNDGNTMNLYINYQLAKSFEINHNQFHVKTHVLQVANMFELLF
jgi:hypothetical protein